MALLVGAACGCSEAPPSAAPPPPEPVAVTQNEPPWFEEVAPAVGVDFRHSSGHTNRFYIPEIMSGGVGLLDFDRDGWLDILCVNGGAVDLSVTNRPGHRLYRNQGNWVFEDVTARAGLGHGELSMGCACADYDGDGWTDIYITDLGRNRLFRNQRDGAFRDVTEEAGVGDRSWSVSAAFFDYDADGHLDLAVANYIRWSREAELNCFSYGGQPDYCSPVNYNAPAMDTLYHNRGDGTFENVTRSAGLDKAYGNGLGIVCADFNEDGKPDIFVANDAVPNQLWINQGSGQFVNEAMIRGGAVNASGIARAGMGVAVGDFDDNGWLDLYVTHLVSEGNGLFLNERGFFTDSIRQKGPTAASLMHTGFGVGFVDFNNDGHLDLYAANGRVKRGADTPDPAQPYAEPNTLLRGLGRLEFTEVLPKGGTSPTLIAASRGCAFGDLDNDGGIDVVVLNNEGTVHVLRNRIAAQGRWVMFRVLNTHGADALGARLRLQAGSQTHHRQVIPNQSYASSNDPRVHCGLGAASQVETVTVTWPAGGVEVFGPFPADQIHEIRQGTGRAPAY